MPKSNEREDILRFLKRPENLDAAWDLAALLPDVVDELNLKFWKTLKTKLSSRIDVMGKVGWKANLDSEDEDLLDDKWPGLRLCQKDRTVEDASLYASFRVEQTYEKKARGKVSDELALALCYGIDFNERINTKSLRDRVPPEADRLAEQLEREGFTKRYEWGWLARKDLPYKIRTRSDAIALASGDNLEDQLATTFFVFFEKHREALEKINGKIARSR